jgi:hypothetical protein
MNAVVVIAIEVDIDIDVTVDVKVDINAIYEIRACKFLALKISEGHYIL